MCDKAACTGVDDTRGPAYLRSLANRHRLEHLHRPEQPSCNAGAHTHALTDLHSYRPNSPMAHTWLILSQWSLRIRIGLNNHSLHPLLMRLCRLRTSEVLNQDLLVIRGALVARNHDVTCELSSEPPSVPRPKRSACLMHRAKK